MGFLSWFHGGPARGRDASRWVDEGAALVDVRSRSEFDEGHLPRALHLPLPKIVAGAVPPAKRAVVYCRSGVRSANAKRVLEARGLSVLDLGAMKNWPTD